MNYHHCCNGIWKVWGGMNNYLYERLMKWGQRRHSNQTKPWIFNRYWKHTHKRWTFTYMSKNKTYTLIPYKLQQKRSGR
jgi:Group II intron, maturase-specific domain